jgi:hypothetical protein
MKHRISLLAVTLSLTAACLVSRAQQPAADAPHAPDGSTMERINNIYIPPLPNAPFTATVTAGWTRTLEDSGTLTVQNHRKVARDSSGRIFQERRWLVPNGDIKNTPLNEIDFSDPTLHELYICFPGQRVCRLQNYYAPVEFNLAQPGELTNRKGKLTREDLGKNTLEGLEVVGTRETVTFDANAFGNNHPLAITKEFWYSQRLGINLLVKRVDPRHGTQIFSVSDIKLAAPDPATFQLPQGYAIQDLRAPSAQQAAQGVSGH